MTHKDLVRNEWMAGYQVLVDRLEPDAPDQDGSYAFTTEAHAEADCPFRYGPHLPMTVLGVPTGEEHQLPPPPEKP